MNKILRIAFVVLIILVCQMFYFVQYAKDDNKYELEIIEIKKELTKEEENRLKEEMAPLVEYGNIIFLLDNNFKAVSAEKVARDYYHEYYGESSGTLLYVNLYNGEMYVFSAGHNSEIITRNKAISIMNKVSKNAAEGKYYKCASRTFAKIYILLSPKTNKNVSQRIIAFFKFYEIPKNICNISVAILISFFISFLAIFSKYKIRSKKKVSEKGKLRYMNVKIIDVYEHK